MIPAAPWHSRVDALLWLHRAVPAACQALPAQLAARAALPVTIGGLGSYRDGPVGPYREVFGSPLLLREVPPLVHVTFIAVDSEPSVAGGRANWALPKVLGSFDGDPGRPGPVSARGDGWELHATATARSRRVPFWATVRCGQLWGDGELREFSLRLRGRARLARVEVQRSSIEWLAEGRHLAVLISGTQDVSAPRG